MNATAQLYLLDGELITESGFQNNIISFSTKKFAKGLYLIKVRQAHCPYLGRGTANYYC